MTQGDFIYAALGGLAGSLITFLTATATTWIIQRNETKRHTRKILVEFAIQNWTEMSKAADRLAAGGNVDVTLMPLDVYLIHAAKLLEVLDMKKITPERAKILLVELAAVTKIACESTKPQERQ